MTKKQTKDSTELFIELEASVSCDESIEECEAEYRDYMIEFGDMPNRTAGTFVFNFDQEAGGFTFEGWLQDPDKARRLINFVKELAGPAKASPNADDDTVH